MKVFLTDIVYLKYFKSITILASVLFVLYREAIVVYGKTFAANAGGRGFNSHRGQNLFFTLYSINVVCEEMFCKTNIKLVKLIKIWFRKIWQHSNLNLSLMTHLSNATLCFELQPNKHVTKLKIWLMLMGN